MEFIGILPVLHFQQMHFEEEEEEEEEEEPVYSPRTYNVPRRTYNRRVDSHYGFTLDNDTVVSERDFVEAVGHHRSLRVARVRIEDITVFHNFTGLTSLEFYWCTMCNVELEFLSGLHNLISLKIIGGEGSYIPWINSLKKLEVLEYEPDNPEMQRFYFCDIEDLTSLRTLVVSHCECIDAWRISGSLVSNNLN